MGIQRELQGIGFLLSSLKHSGYLIVDSAYGHITKAHIKLMPIK